MAVRRRQTPAGRPAAGASIATVERWLEAERAQLPLWMPVGLIVGVAAWYALPGAAAWRGWLLACAALAAAGLGFGGGGRLGRAIALFVLCGALGCGLIWWRAERAATPRLERAQVASFDARIERAEPLPARQAVRLLLAPLAMPTLPARLRVTIDADKAPAGLGRGAVVRLRARLVPPPAAAVPGAYDYSAIAWFDGVGATGKALDPVVVVTPARRGGPAEWLASARIALSAHIQARLPGGAGGVASALATGDMGAVTQDDNDAFRRSGLAHLLSVSGLHLTAAVGATMVLVLRLLALSPWLALRAPLPLIAAGAGALAGVAYTLLTGSEVPTVRSLVAALIVLAGLALGRETATLRLVATGATIVLVSWPESAAGPSFQLSFAAILSIVALHELPWTHATFAARDEAAIRRVARALGELLLTGLVVEVALMPIALFHFHRAGFYGAVANIVAIPLTTFVIMPAEAVALLLDTGGVGAPAWWATGLALRLLLRLAHLVAALPGAVALLPTLGWRGYALIVAGGLWLALWRTRVRLAGLVPIVAGIAMMTAAGPADLLVTGDGRHVALRTRDGAVALLRDRTGDYVRSALAELVGREGDAALAIEDLPEARCGPDTCAATLVRGGRAWRLLATRSPYPVDRAPFARACAAADVVVSDRRLPGWCRPRWLKADATLLARTGGLAIRLDPPSVTSVAAGQAEHPWAIVPRPFEARRAKSELRGAKRRNNPALHSRPWTASLGSR